MFKGERRVFVFEQSTSALGIGLLTGWQNQATSIWPLTSDF